MSSENLIEQYAIHRECSEEKAREELEQLIDAMWQNISQFSERPTIEDFVRTVWNSFSD